MVRLQLEQFITDAHACPAILEYELPLDSRRPGVIVLEHGAVAVLDLEGALFPTRAALDQAALPGRPRERRPRAARRG